MIAVVKIGGGIIEDEKQLSAFLTSFAQLKGPKVLVHGGGRLATSLGARMGITANMVEGRRVTDEATLELVTMVYGGLANKKIVAQLQASGINALGLSGADGNVILSHKRAVKKVDYGWVGDVETVNVLLLETLLNQGVVPVLAPLTHDGKGNMLNTNADTIASELAKALAQSGKETQLIFGFELNGVLRDFEDKSSVIAEINSSTYQDLKAKGVIADGMIPKLDNAFQAINAGVKSVRICHALKVGSANAAENGTLIL